MRMTGGTRSIPRSRAERRARGHARAPHGGGRMSHSLRYVRDLTDSVWSRLERVTDRFEASWRRGERPSIEDYLPDDAGEDRRSILIELVHAELEFRLGAGEPARVEDYLARYPELALGREEVWGLIEAEAELRRLADPDLAPGEYLGRFPAFARELEAYWRGESSGARRGDALPGGPGPAPGRTGPPRPIAPGGGRSGWASSS